MGIHRNAWVSTRFTRLHVIDALTHLERAIMGQPTSPARDTLTEINIKLMEIRDQLTALREDGADLTHLKKDPK